MGLQVFRVEDEVSSSKILEIACGELSIEVVQGRSSSSRRRREVLRPHLANVKQTVPKSIRAIFRLHVIKTEHALHEPTVLRQITHMIGYQAPGSQAGLAQGGLETCVVMQPQCVGNANPFDPILECWAARWPGPLPHLLAVLCWSVARLCPSPTRRKLLEPQVW